VNLDLSRRRLRTRSTMHAYKWTTPVEVHVNLVFKFNHPYPAPDDTSSRPQVLDVHKCELCVDLQTTRPVECPRYACRRVVSIRVLRSFPRMTSPSLMRDLDDDLAMSCRDQALYAFELCDRSGNDFKFK
jgi:hypothetical protein